MRRLACALFVGALVLAGCGGEDPPAPVPTSVATTPANPGVTLPPMPERADEFSPTGANRFVTYYVSLLNYASKTGDVEELTRVSDPDCGGCSDYISFYESTYADGGWIKGRDWERANIKLWFDDRDGGESRATTRLSIAAGTLKLSGNAVETAAPASDHVVTLGLRFDGVWSMTQLVAGDPT